jgi:nitrite reductase/ring-hydroxylating ferredoxin subunit
MTERTHVVCRASELQPGERRIVDVDGLSIGVFNVKGRYYALYNRCPHRGAPVCQGKLIDLVGADGAYAFRLEREGEILRCPWHAWEFDVTDGRSVFNPHRVRVRSYEVSVEEPDEADPSLPTFPVTVEDRMVVLHLPGGNGDAGRKPGIGNL